MEVLSGRHNTEVGDGRPRAEHMRAADRDRNRVAEVLREAHAEGRLTLTEFDERTALAYAARTYADLAALTADLPAPGARAEVTSVLRQAHRPHPRVAAWVLVNTICLLVWGISCVAAGQWLYPWWIWVAGPWGLVMLRAQLGHRVCATAHRSA